MKKNVCTLALCLLPSSLSAQAVWTRQWPQGALPAPRFMHTLAFDAARNRTVLFGGNYSLNPFGDTWLFDGTSWSQAVGPGPSPRWAVGMAFDAARGLVVMFGGANAVTGLLDETWEWDGAAWHQRVLSFHPSSRVAEAFAYDTARHRCVLFGGSGLADTWEYDGTAWVILPTPTRPSARSGAGFAFEPAGSRMILFGGATNNGNTALDETWAWDGSNWSFLTPATPPFARQFPLMVSAPDRGRIVLFGGFPYDPLTWEWDGAQWHVQPTVGPIARLQGGMAYDTVQRRLVLFGGNGQGSILQDTWTWASPAPADFTAYGNGCPGSAGTPSLTAGPNSLPWTGDVFVTRVDSLPTNGGVMLVTGVASTPGISLAPYGLPACSGFVTHDAVQVAAASGSVATWATPVPHNTALAGVHVYQQAVAIDGLAPGGAAVSNAGDLQVGIR